MNTINRADRYKQYFTRDYLMGPNSFCLLDELIRRNPYKNSCPGDWTGS